ncbi:MAG TPA: response regulator [Thermoanaerobaculia bacterium]|jgi:DNA-binding response OmpR family regulator
MEKRVLVVEDDAPIRVMVSAVLAQANFAVETCRDAGEALPQLDQQQFGVVVLSMDSSSPESDAAILDRLHATEEPPCVVLISAGSQPKLDSVVSQLVRARLRKPFDISELVAAVRGCFNS